MEVERVREEIFNIESFRQFDDKWIDRWTNGLTELILKSLLQLKINVWKFSIRGVFSCFACIFALFLPFWTKNLMDTFHAHFRGKNGWTFSTLFLLKGSPIYSKVQINPLSWIRVFLNFSIKSWSNFKIRDSFGKLRTCRFQNCP